MHACMCMHVSCVWLHRDALQCSTFSHKRTHTRILHTLEHSPYTHAYLRTRTQCARAHSLTHLSSLALCGVQSVVPASQPDLATTDGARLDTGFAEGLVGNEVCGEVVVVDDDDHDYTDAATRTSVAVVAVAAAAAAVVALVA
jgi:hypothetical protein